MRSCPTDYVDSFSSQAWSAICPNNRCLAKFSPTCPSTLFISSWSEDPLSADGFQAVGQLEGGSCNGHEGMATALQCNPLNNHPFKVLFFLKTAVAGHILSRFPIIFALRHFRLQNIPFSLSQVCRSARFCKISTAHNLSECVPVVLI